jgi:nucleotide-binding universal stress UspA family protein
VTIVVGVPPDGRGEAALDLAAMLARSTDDELVLCTVVPAPWPPSPAKVDAEYRAHLEAAANEALDAQLPTDVPAATVVHHARSVRAGLLEVAERRSAAFLVVGSPSAGVLHSSPIPVALPGEHRGERVTRVTAAYGGSADELVVAAAALAARIGVPLRVASFAVRSHPPYTSGVGTEAEAAIVEQWIEEIEAALEAVGDVGETVIGRGESWEEAVAEVAWRDGDVLVVGSSSTGPVARVFLGSRAAKIVRASPVPIVVLPRDHGRPASSRA